MTTQTFDIVDDSQLEAVPLVGGRVEVVARSRVGRRQVSLLLSPEAARGLLEDLDKAIDLAETAEAS